MISRLLESSDKFIKLSKAKKLSYMINLAIFKDYTYNFIFKNLIRKKIIKILSVFR